MAKNPQVAIYLFDQVEDLDFAGPLEVFGSFARPDSEDLFEVTTVSQHSGIIRTRNGLRVMPEHDFGDCPGVDILVVPGGIGTRNEIQDPRSGGLGPPHRPEKRIRALGVHGVLDPGQGRAA